MLLLVISFVLFQPIIGFSEDVTGTIDDFSYEIIFPENQKNDKVGYYDLLVKPGMQQTVQMKLVNASKQPMKIDIAISSAKTNSNGIATFSPNELKNDKSLKHDLSKIMAGPKNVSVPANSSTIVDFTIDVPQEAFEGFVTGGIQLKPVLKEKETSEQDKIISNKFAFVVGVLLSESEIQSIQPELKLNDVSLKLKDGGYALFVNISNTKSVFAEGLTITTNIRKKGQNKSLVELEKKQLRMAPNSIMEMPVFLNGQTVSAGEYTADVKATAKNGQTWKWARNFKLSKIQATQINKQALIDNSPEPKKNWWWLLPIVLVLLGTMAISFFYYKMKQHKKSNESLGYENTNI